MKDLSKLTIGEIARIEELSGKTISSIGEDAPVNALAAMAFVWARREDKKLTWKTVQDDWTLEDVQAVLGITDEDSEEDPKDN